MTWSIEHEVGRAAQLHAREVTAADRETLRWLEVERPALVLGSTQPASSIDADAAAAAGIDVARRRSGGGAVLVRDGDLTWVDVSIGRDDPRWTDDVSRSFDWLGQAWATVLGELGVAGATVHRGPLRPGPWSSAVCFGGLGPGEVLVGERKVVGIAQRRTRDGARFQCAVLRRWDPAAIASLLAGEVEVRRAATAELARHAVGLADLVDAQVTGDVLVGSLAAVLTN